MKNTATMAGRGIILVIGMLAGTTVTAQDAGILFAQADEVACTMQFDPVCGVATVYGPSFKCFTIEEIDPLFLLKISSSVNWTTIG